MIPIVLFWLSLAVIFYTFAGYPLALAIVSAIRPRPWLQQPCEPFISIVISAYNEADRIGAKVRNLLALDYPDDRLEILIGSDGSTDSTAEQLLAISDRHVRSFIFTQRRGKPAVLNALLPEARGEIVVLCDVRQKFEPTALHAFARSFADPAVGAVSGEVTMAPAETTAVTEGTGFYWRYETFIRSRESRIDSTIGVTGNINAIRKTLFESIPHDTILDDVLLPMRISRRGYRVVVDHEARAVDITFPEARQEFTRKVRTIAGNFQLFARERWLLNPLRNRLWWQTISHKVLRLLIAPLQVVLLLSNVAALNASPVYKAGLVGQILFYGAAIAECVLPRKRKKSFVLTVPFFLCLLSWTTVVAFLRSITGRQPVTWQKAAAGTEISS